MSAERPEYDLEAWRRRIPVLARARPGSPRIIPLNNCSHSPMCDVTRAALDAYADSWDGDVMNWDAWMDQVDRAKAAFARLINATPEEVALVPSVTAATAIIASALDLTAERNRVLISEAEFPTVGHVWLSHERYGARVEWVPLTEGVIDPAGYERRIDRKTRLVCACHAYYVNGFVQDVATIASQAHAAGASIFVDAYQTAGIHPIDVHANDVDFLTAGVHKFLMGVPGVAFLYVKRELIERLEPALTGWFAREDIFAFDPRRLDWAATANRFEMSTPPVPNAYVARASLEMLQGIGIDAIAAWAGQRGRQLVDGARARGLRLHGTTDANLKTPTTAIVCPTDSADIERRLRERGILAASRGPVVRLAPHFFTTVGECETALDAVAELFESAVPPSSGER